MLKKNVFEYSQIRFFDKRKVKVEGEAQVPGECIIYYVLQVIFNLV